MENNFGVYEYGLEEGQNEGEEGYIVTITDTGRRYFVSKNGKVEQMILGPKVSHILSTEEQVEVGETVIITVNAEATEGKITKITKPDGTTVENSLQVEYEVGTNGKYKFIVEQSNGGRTTYTVEITNIKPKTVADLKVGERVNYIDKNENTIECIVLYDTAYNQSNGTNYGVQVISSDIVDKITLGDENKQKSKESYDNSINTLNNKAQEYLNEDYAIEARCIGSISYTKEYEQLEKANAKKASDYYWLAYKYKIRKN